MTTPDEQKKMITEIYEALLKAGKVIEKQQFFEPLEIKPSYGSNILHPSSRNRFPKNRVGKLFSVWHVSPEWWYHKKGTMFTDGDLTESNKIVANNLEVKENYLHIAIPNKTVPGVGTKHGNWVKPIERNIIPIPIVQKRAQAGYALDYADPEYIEHLPKIYVSNEFEKGNYVAFEVSGDSMDDDRRHAVCDGDVVLAKELHKNFWRDKLHFGKYLFVIVYNEGCVIKQITNHDPDTGNIECHSFNPFFEDFTINLKDVYQLLYVVKVVDRTIRI